MQLFEAHAAENPSAACLMSADGSELTYWDVNARANQLAHRLAADGIGPGTTVAVMMDKCFELYLALLAVLKAGAAYLPLDPGAPAARVASMLHQASAALLISKAAVMESLTAPPSVQTLLLDGGWRPFRRQPTANLPARCDVDALAYVIYTSGSTGEPKGIAVPHAGAVNTLTHEARQRRAGGVKPGDAFLQARPVLL